MLACNDELTDHDTERLALTWPVLKEMPTLLGDIIFAAGNRQQRHDTAIKLCSAKLQAG